VGRGHVKSGALAVAVRELPVLGLFAARMSPPDPLRVALLLEHAGPGPPPAAYGVEVRFR
jgi:hypothetical protein